MTAYSPGSDGSVTAGKTVLAGGRDVACCAPAAPGMATHRILIKDRSRTTADYIRRWSIRSPFNLYRLDTNPKENSPSADV